MKRILVTGAKGQLGTEIRKHSGRIPEHEFTYIDIEDLDAEIGDEVEIVSSDINDYNSIKNIAELEKTITYQVLVRLNLGIRRNIV